jgi:polyferredoxin
VCPTGIDIRAGLQYECIACGACVDACDAVMDKMRYPRGLIRYTSESALLGGKRRVLRPRVAVYALILAALVGAFAFSVAHRVPLIIDVLRDRNALFRVAVSGEVQNVYTVKLMNKDLSAHRYRIALEAPAGIALASDPGEIAAAAEQALSLTLTLRAAPGVARGRADVAFRVHSIDTPAIAYRQKSSFFAPP